MKVWVLQFLINTVQPIINNLKQYGYVKDRAMLGITGQYIDATTARFYGLTQGYSIVKLNSNVSDAGLQKSDIITKIDGNNVSSETTVQNVIAKEKTGRYCRIGSIPPNYGRKLHSYSYSDRVLPYELAFTTNFFHIFFPEQSSIPALFPFL